MADTIVVFVLTRHWVLGASYDCPRLVHCARSHNQLLRAAGFLLDVPNLITALGIISLLLWSLANGYLPNTKSATPMEPSHRDNRNSLLLANATVFGFTECPNMSRNSAVFRREDSHSPSCPGMGGTALVLLRWPSSREAVSA